jgi:Domain of unknown function (DUF6362)
VDNWTIETVEMRLDDAAEVMRRLPPVRVPGYFNTWPSMMVEFADCVGREARPMRLPPPSTAAITRMEEALCWLRWLERDDVKLVWARSERTPWKAICCRFGISRATANRRHQYALSLIAWRLNGRKPPTKRSRDFLIERMSS